MSEPTFTQLFPLPDASAQPPSRAPELTAASYLSGLDLRGRVPAQSPLVLANMVSSFDGNTTFDGRSAPLSDAGDRRLFHALRAGSDAILAGTGTLGAESYGPASEGRPVITATRSGRIPTDIPLLKDPHGRVIIFTGQRLDLPAARAQVTIEPLSDNLAMLRTLRSRYGIEVLLCEGGPTLLGALLREQLVDEIFLTLAPRTAAGTAGPMVTAGAPASKLVEMDLGSVLERQSTLYLRYRRLPEPPEVSHDVG
jgi:riboflavin biosynthesis pyrimidine reductase